MRMMDYEARGIPFGRPAEVNLRNNHAQYIFTWSDTTPAVSSQCSLLTHRQVRLMLGHNNHAVHGREEAGQ